jgi:serine/threonine-protein kinase
VNLEQFIEQHRKIGRPIPIDLAAFIVSRIARPHVCACQSIARAAPNIVHRDIGPKNVMLAYEGDVN